MVQPTGLEPVTSSFAGRRSNPTELRLHIFWMSGLYLFFAKCKRKMKHWIASYLAMTEQLITSRHPIKIKSLKIGHRFGEKVFLFPFFEEASFVDDPESDKCICIFTGKFFLRKRFLVLHISGSLLVRHIEP